MRIRTPVTPWRLIECLEEQAFGLRDKNPEELVDFLFDHYTDYEGVDQRTMMHHLWKDAMSGSKRAREDLFQYAYLGMLHPCLPSKLVRVAGSGYPWLKRLALIASPIKYDKRTYDADM